jgi:hypothetical protein
MATYVASVNKALSPQADIVKHAGAVFSGPRQARQIGCAVGQQVRIIRNHEEYALYTVHEVRQEDPDNVSHRPGPTRRGLAVRRCDQLAGAESDLVGKESQ